MADDFFPPREIPREENLLSAFADPFDPYMYEKLIEIIPNLNYD